MMRMDAVTPEQGYMASARAFFPSFELLAVSGDPHARALSLVGGLIVECLLKAYIARKNSKPDEPGGTVFGHDLELLWQDVAQAGLSVDSVAPVWCVVLNCLHCGNKDAKNRSDDLPVPVELRYPLRYQSKMNGLSFPVAGEMLAGVRALRNSIDHALLS